MKKYRTWYDDRIEAVEAVKETANYVTIRETWMGRASDSRCAKRSDSMNYFDSWAEARDFLVDREKAEIDRARNEMDMHTERLAKIMEMKPHDNRI